MKTIWPRQREKCSRTSGSVSPPTSGLSHDGQELSCRVIVASPILIGRNPEVDPLRDGSHAHIQSRRPGIPVSGTGR